MEEVSVDVPEYPDPKVFEAREKATPFESIPMEAKMCDIFNRIGRILNEDPSFYDYMHFASILGRTCDVVQRSSKKTFTSKGKQLYDLCEEMKEVLCQKK